jgi:hypothetical protein
MGMVLPFPRTYFVIRVLNGYALSLAMHFRRPFREAEAPAQPSERKHRKEMP